MVVGDLVTLSSYGLGRKINRNCATGYGIIIKILQEHDGNYPFLVLWLEGDKSFKYYFSRKELKYYNPSAL